MSAVGGEVVLPVLAALGVSTDLLTLGAHYGLDIDTRLLVRIFGVLIVSHSIFLVGWLVDVHAGGLR